MNLSYYTINMFSEMIQSSLLMAVDLVSICGLETAGSFANSASYIDCWKKRIAEDNKLVVTASSKAEKAVKYILNLNTEN